MDKAIIALTKGGMETGKKLLVSLEDSVLYLHPKFYFEEEGIHKIEGNITEFIGTIFGKYRCLIFIMATGIVVRGIAPYLQDKKKDPAVIVLDERGLNVISLLSGHIGGANACALEIAKLLGANPVITTASDVGRKIAVDTLAMKLNCQIEDFQAATRITAHIVNDEKVGIVSEFPINLDLPNNLYKIQEDEIDLQLKGIIYITEKNNRVNFDIDTVVLRPRNIILGIGCKRGKSEEEILDAIVDALSRIGVSTKSIKHIATVDVKKDEEGIIGAAKALGVPLITVERDQIQEVEDNFLSSKFVKNSIGVGSVCEPAAVLSSTEGKLIQGKKTYEGITIAVVREGGNDYGNHSARDKL